MSTRGNYDVSTNPITAILILLGSLVGSGHIDKGAILSAAGDSTWATSSDFQVTSNNNTLGFVAYYVADTLSSSSPRRSRPSLPFSTRKLVLRTRPSVKVSTLAEPDMSWLRPKAEASTLALYDEILNPQHLAETVY